MGSNGSCGGFHSRDSKASTGAPRDLTAPNWHYTRQAGLLGASPVKGDLLCSQIRQKISDRGKESWISGGDQKIKASVNVPTQFLVFIHGHRLVSIIVGGGIHRIISEDAMNFAREVETARRLRAEAKHLREDAQAIWIKAMATNAANKAARDA